MDEQNFNELLESVAWMGRHTRGEESKGRTTAVPDPDVRFIREKTGLSQARFSALIGVNIKTLQNWEQKRVRPTGPARALLQIVAIEPQVALRTLHHQIL